MKKSRKYRATDVKNVLVDRVLAAAPEGAVTAGIDTSRLMSIKTKYRFLFSIPS